MELTGGVGSDLFSAQVGREGAWQELDSEIYIHIYIQHNDDDNCSVPPTKLSYRDLDHLSAMRSCEFQAGWMADDGVHSGLVVLLD